jgi:two-component sensor histidine kinase
MSVSLIVAELVTNSLKHAFEGRSDGNISVRIASEKGAYVLTVADDGPGMPVNAQAKKGGSLGQGILQSLAGQLHGRISFEPGPGTVAKLVFSS